MDRTKLFLYTKNKSYGEKLLRFIVGQHNPDIDVELLTEIRDKTQWEKDACVVTDDENTAESLECQTILLVKVPEAAGKQEIFMYQRGREIYRQILRLTGADMRRTKKKKELSVPKVTCIFSPGESEEKTIFALRTAMDRTERGTTLYVSLCGFPVSFWEGEDGSPGVGREGVSEVMLCSGYEIFEEKLRQLTFPMGKITVLAPPKHFKDLFDFTPEEVKRLIRHLKQQTLYDSVVIETGQLFEFTFAMLAEADEILVPEEPGILAEGRRQVLREYCRCEKQEELWEHMRFVPVSVRRPEDWKEVSMILGEGGEIER